jgi:hypothetical protein
MAEVIGKAEIIVEANGDGFEQSVRRQVGKAAPGMEKEGQSLWKHFKSGWDKDAEKDTDVSMRRLQKTMGKHQGGFAKIGNVIGRAFGRGSRNDLLNAFGGFISIAPRIMSALAGVGGWVAGLGAHFQELQKAAGGGIGGAVSALGSSLSSLTAGLPGLVLAAAAVAVTIQAVLLLLPALGAAVSLVSGLVLALAGSLGFALVGALGAVAGALVPFAAGIGVAALAMGGLSKKSQGLKDLKDTWKDLQKSAAKAVFGKDGAGLKNLDPILKSLKPLIKGVGGALNGLLTDLGKAGKSKEFQNMMKGIGDMLPGMVTKIGGIAGKLGLGLGQAFVAAEPLITRFLGFVDDLATKFVAFSKPDKKGKSGLSEFFDSAMASAEIIGPLILDIIDLVGKLFGAGKGTGDKIFADIAKQVEKIVTWLSTPEGQKAIEQWFEDAQELAGALGRIVGQVIAFVDALDTPTSRATLLQILSVIEDIIGALTWAATTLDVWNTAILQLGADIMNWALAVPAMFMGAMATVKGTVVVAFNEIKTAIGQTITDIGAFFAPAWAFIITGVKQFVMAFIQVFIDLYNELVGHSIIPDMIMDIVGWFARLPGMIAGVLGDLAGRFVIWLAGVPQKIQSSVGLVVGAFGGLAQKAIARAGNIAAGFGKWVAGLPAKARAMATTVAAGFTNLAGKIISKAGSIAGRFASWVSSLAGKARSTAVSIVGAFSGLASKIISRAGSIASKFGSWVASLPGKAKTIANNIASAFSGLAGKIISRAGDIASKFASWGSKAVASAGRVANNIVSKFSGLASRIVNAIGNIVPKIKMPNIPRPTVQAIVKVIKPKTAAGGIFSGAQERIIGEAGPEAVVPLTRALSRVDPAVRALSAFAQGMTPPGKDSGPSIGRQIDVGGIVINTPTTDPRAVASEVVTRLTFASYI